MGFHNTASDKKRCACGTEISRKSTSGLCRACGTQKAHADRAFTPADDAILRKYAVGNYRVRDLQERFFPKRTVSSVKARIDNLRVREREKNGGETSSHFDAIRASRRLFERQLATGQIASVPRMIEWHDRHNQSIAA